MRHKMTARAALGACAIGVASAGAHSQETITIVSGQVGGAPADVGSVTTGGAYTPGPDDGGFDDSITVLPGGTGPMTLTGFTGADFAGAQSGASARTIVPHFAPAWIQTIPNAPDARWIHANHGTPTRLGSGSPPTSVLYAVPFSVSTVAPTAASIDIYFAVDDRLGDAANAIEGMYINGVALSGSTGGGRNFESRFTASFDASILNPSGPNYFYLYQYDGGSVGGSIFGGSITVVPAPGAGGLMAIGALGAARRRRR